MRKEELLSGAASVSDHSTASALDLDKERLHAAAGKPEDETESYSRRPIARFLAGLERWSTLITLGIGLIGLLVITLQTIIYVQQRRIMDKQTQVMGQQVQQAEKSFRISERAYVGVASLDPDFERKEVLIMLENIGKVPARKVMVEAHAYRHGDQLSGSTKYFEAGSVQLFPGSLKMAVVIPMPNFRAEEAEGILTRKVGFYVAGIIKYEDGFGNMDSTNFSFRYKPPPNEQWTADSDLTKQLETPRESGESHPSP